MRDGTLCRVTVVIVPRSASPGPRSIGMVSSMAQGAGCSRVGRTHRRHWLRYRRPVHTAALPYSHAVLRVGCRSWAAMDIAGRRYGHCRTSLWTLSGATLNIVGRGYGPCPAPPWTLSAVAMDLVRRHLGPCPAPLWTLPCRRRALTRPRLLVLRLPPPFGYAQGGQDDISSPSFPLPGNPLE